MKNGQLRTMSKGKKGYFLKDIEGNKFIEIDKIRYEAEISTRVPESSYKKKEVKNYVRKGKEAGTVVIMKKEYVLIRTDGSYIEIPTGVEIDEVEKVYVRYVEAGIYAIVCNDKYRIIKEKEFDQQKSGQIPLSNHSAERIQSQNGLK